MSTKLAVLIIGILVFIYGTPVLAANSSGGGQSSGTTQQIQSQTQVQVQTQTMTGSPTGMQVRNQEMTQTEAQTQNGASETDVQIQNQTQMQNQGEDQSLQVSTQGQEKLGVGGSFGGQQILMSVDAATGTLDSILTVAMAKGSPGEKIQMIVQTQSEAQKTIKTELQKMDARQGLIKSLIGPDYKAMKVMTQQMEQNQLRITELEQLKIELANQGDIMMVEEAIQTLTDQNTALQDKLSLEEQTNSLLGWLFRFFAQ